MRVDMHFQVFISLFVYIPDPLTTDSDFVRSLNKLF